MRILSTVILKASEEISAKNGRRQALDSSDTVVKLNAATCNYTLTVDLNLHLCYIHGCITSLLHNFASSHVRGEAFRIPAWASKSFSLERTFDSPFVRLRPLLFSPLPPPRLVLISNPVQKQVYEQFTKTRTEARTPRQSGTPFTKKERSRLSR